MGAGGALGAVVGVPAPKGDGITKGVSTRVTAADSGIGGVPVVVAPAVAGVEGAVFVEPLNQ